ncbi:TPA: hypothetical protein VBX77_001751 [Yersinia enterocolitica]|nr:hypothetical protein [Yersinia enterocolitica]
MKMQRLFLLPILFICTKAKEGNNRKLMLNEKIGATKSNLRFTRFSVRGKSKVEKENGLA